jgi:acyl-CoA synthetase (AMP-forming)/AMP-acid ligase II
VDHAGLVRAAGTLTVGGLFRAQAALQGDRIALQQGGRQLTYAALDERVNRLAGVLAARGIARGDRVAILSENRTEYVELDLAAAKLGAIVACQNWRQSGEELRHCLRLVAPSLVLASERFAAMLARVDHGVGQVLMLGEEYEHALARQDAHEPQSGVDAEDGLVILYTSGTTGSPKAAVISHRAMIARGIVQRIDRPTDPDDAFVAWTPMFHMGSTDAVFGSLLRGAKVIVMDGFDAVALAATVAQETLGHLTVVPGVVEQVIAELRSSSLRPRGVKAVGVMADLVSPAQIAELTGLLDAPYCNTFGSTETGSPPASKGLIAPGVTPARLSKEQSSLCEIRLVDSEDREVPDGESGEMTLRGPTLFSGYWGMPEETAADFRGGWFHMGDVFVRNADGTLDFVDRSKYLIKSGGENIYPAEIERLLLASSRIAQAVVVRRPDARWGEVPVALVVARDAGLTAAEVIDLCRGRIASYKLPREVRFVSDSDLPRNVSGKIERRHCEALAASAPHA